MTITSPEILPARRTGDGDFTKISKRPLDRDEARQLTAEIRQSTVRLWFLVKEAQDREAWAALGYASWKEYADKELQLSESRSYQLLNQAKVMQIMASAGVDPLSIEPVPTRVVQRVKDNPTAIRRATRKAIKEGTDPVKAIREIANRMLRPEPAKPEPEPEAAPPAEPKPPRRARSRAQPVEPAADLPEGMVTCPCCAGIGYITAEAAESYSG